MINKKHKISVILAVYNTEKYVSKCLDSLLNQTYDNLEILVIEDGSTDNSKKILEEYSKNKKIKLIFNDKNRGLAYSRNVGLENATGDYIGFIDSDDYIQNNYYELLYNSIIENKADISVCDMKLIYEDNGNEDIVKCCEGEDYKLIDFVDNGLAASACNKLFKKDIINKYRFSVGKVNEDIAVVIPALCDAKKICYAKDCYYNYYQRGTSIQNSAFSLKRFDIFDGVKSTIKRIKNHKDHEELSESIVFNQIILLYIFKIIKIKGFFLRYKMLKEYSKRIKDLPYYRPNKYFINFIGHQGGISMYYFRILNFLNNRNFILLENFIIFSYNVYRNIKRVLRFIFKRKKVTRKVDNELLRKVAIKQSKMKEPKYKISVVVPNYNYSNYLHERIYSILYQNYKIHELIILDDCSKDNSIEVINEIVDTIKPYVNVKTIINKKNSGSSFIQWEKGFNESNGDYVWIAEADDYCDRKFLSKITKNMDSNTAISLANTSFMNSKGIVTIDTIFKYMDTEETGHWKKSFKIDGREEYGKYMFLNNTIPNVSSCIIKNSDYKEAFIEASKYKQAGDWIFYAIVIQNGNVCFTRNVNNYYREHGNNVSSTFKKEAHFNEIKSIHKYFDDNYKLSKVQKELIEKRYKFLKNAWKI